MPWCNATQFVRFCSVLFGSVFFLCFFFSSFLLFFFLLSSFFFLFYFSFFVFFFLFSLFSFFFSLLSSSQFYKYLSLFSTKLVLAVSSQVAPPGGSPNSLDNNAHSAGGCCGTGVYGLSCVCCPWLGAFIAVQPCCPDWSQDRVNVNFSCKESGGS